MKNQMPPIARMVYRRRWSGHTVDIEMMPRARVQPVPQAGSTGDSEADPVLEYETLLEMEIC
jgi:hypothetical protein